MATFSAGGALSRADLLTLWTSVTDPAYNQPIITAGDGNGLEVFTQMLQQMARVSTAIDVSMQSMYILPWSGQTNPSAAGAAKATVTLSFTRTGLLNLPLTLGAGVVFFEEQQTDFAVGHGTTVLTGRRYSLMSDLVFEPGVATASGVAQAENPGWGYNNPLPNRIVVTDQSGTGYANNLATLTTSFSAVAAPGASGIANLNVQNKPNTVVPQHIGQYVILTAGLNIGQIARVVSYSGPNLAQTPPSGGTVNLELVASVQGGTFAGSFQVREVVQIKNGATIVGYGRFVDQITAAGASRTTLVMMSGVVAPGNTLLGTLGGATVTIDLVLAQTKLVVDVLQTTGWRVLDWVTDWGLSVTNAASPTGGRLGFLDALGKERALPRIASEPDAIYSQRIAQIADQVTPNALKRMLNKVLTIPSQIGWCFREVESPLLPGFFYGPGNVDFYDFDATVVVATLTSGAGFSNPTTTPVVLAPQNLGTFEEPVAQVDASGNVSATGHFAYISGAGPNFQITLVRKTGAFIVGGVVKGLVTGTTYTIGSIVYTMSPALKYRVMLDYLRFRAYILIGVQKSDLGDFGFCYAPQSSTVLGFYDAAGTFMNFYDGAAVNASVAYRNAWQALDRIRAAGVTIEFYQITPGDLCV